MSKFIQNEAIQGEFGNIFARLELNFTNTKR